MRALVPTLCLLLSSCGGLYDGTYAGTLSGTIECDDGTHQSNDATVTWDVTTSGESLTIDPHGTCGTYVGSLFETSGTIDAKTCSGTNSIKGGHLTFSASSVIVSITASTSVSGPTCVATLTGTLNKK
jgi:hypothetical protein